jgi:hypothetical protein
MDYARIARDRAARCTALAAETPDQKVRDALLDLAAGYMKLAGELQRSETIVDLDGYKLKPPDQPAAPFSGL